MTIEQFEVWFRDQYSHVLMSDDLEMILDKVMEVWNVQQTDGRILKNNR